MSLHKIKKLTRAEKAELNSLLNDGRLNEAADYLAQRARRNGAASGQRDKAFDPPAGVWLVPQISLPNDAVEFLASYRHARQEYFLALLLNGKHEVIDNIVVAKGTLNRSLVHPRECFTDALRLRAAAVIFAHNHPAGGTDPSREDIAVTERLCKAGELLGINVLDHVIIGGSEFRSMLSAGDCSLLGS